MDFLNQFLPEHHRIETLSFRNSEQLGVTDRDRRAIFDIYCENQNGEKFVVELQKAKQNYFKDRTVYYSTFPIKEQAERGDWIFKLKAVYCIGILDFVFDESENKGEYLHTIKLKNQNNKIFYDKLTFIYIEMPNFKKTELQLENKTDKWLYFLKNLEEFEHIPSILGEPVFDHAFKTAELSQLNPKEMENYEHSLKIYRDFNNVLETAKEEGMEEGIAQGIKQGREEGREEGRAETLLSLARALKAEGMTPKKIASLTGLSNSEIDKI